MDYINFISSTHIDILKEVGNIGAGHSATSLSKLLEKKIDMNVPDVKIVSFNDLMEWVGGPDVVIASVFLRIEGDIPGSLFFVLSIEQAERFIKQLIGDDQFTLKETPYNELGLSAFQELGNILTGSYLSSLSDLTDLTIYPSVPALTIDMFGAVMSHGLIELSHAGDFAIIIDTAIKEEDQLEEDSVKGHFFLLPDPDSFKKLFDALGVNDEE
ncbi:chemotaxis protein CheC [Metabacillus litoralis]|uniref:chemotaxis protein CheC n=1 Tax=Metabacillus TaxID=2675233 RepID=UPI000EF57A76|nr:chemotaxis protein CheC [Metabacillus litoralis]MCM3160524.1 chemotaxis protein CheC [Metabacillus litoralis]MCM3409109.1 chemotaxis protein CheC [Metabacillus litoralis]